MDRTSPRPLAGQPAFGRRHLLRRLLLQHEEERTGPPVRIFEGRCVAFLGPVCTSCVGHCPAGAEEAVVLVAGRPVVDTDLCTGCRRCQDACPTSPAAIGLH